MTFYLYRFLPLMSLHAALLGTAPMILIFGCGEKGASMVSPANSFDPFKAEIAERFNTIVPSWDDPFLADFDAAVEFLEAKPVREVSTSLFGSSSDLITLRKEFHDLVGEVQIKLESMKRDQRLVTPEWYRSIPIELINLMTASTLLRRAATVEQDQQDYSDLLQQASVTIRLPMKRPDSPFDVYLLIQNARRACAQTYLALDRESDKDDPSDYDYHTCTQKAFRAIPSLWVMTVVNSRLGIVPHPLVQRMNWISVVLYYMGTNGQSTRSKTNHVILFLTRIERYLMDRSSISPRDMGFFRSVLLRMQYLDKGLYTRSSCAEESRILCVVKGDRPTQEFMSHLDLDPRGIFKN
jgi:hypothetical protein